MKKYHRVLPFVLQKIGYVISFILLKFFVRLEIRGKENLKHVQGPVILATNHTSELDPSIFVLTLPFLSKLFPLYFVSNPQYKYRTFGWRSYFYGGAFFNMLGAYPLYLGKRNYGLALQNHIFLLRKGRSVCIFPEGKRTPDGHLSKARGGLGYLSYITETPVVPVAINTFYNITFKEFVLRRRKVVVTIGKPMSFKELVPENNPKVEDFQRGAQKVMDRIGEMMAE